MWVFPLAHLCRNEFSEGDNEQRPAGLKVVALAVVGGWGMGGKKSTLSRGNS